MKLAQRIFNVDSQSDFATLSRDFNPMHMSPIFARRTQHGAPIVHGVHSLLWLLESIAAQQTPPACARHLKVRFRRPIYLGELCSAEMQTLTPQSMSARVVVGDVEAVAVFIKLGAREDVCSDVLSDTLPDTMDESSTPKELDLEQLPGRSGSVSFDSIVEQTRGHFPNAVRWLGLQEISAIVCSSYLVGMVVPGLHSLYSGLTTSLGIAPMAGASTLRYSVASIDSRFRLVTLNIAGGGLCGSLETVSRPPPARQPGMQALRSTVTRGEFRGSRSLIVGGSRGLGELTAKLLASGGGQVVITHTLGKADVNAVAEEINRAGAECQTLHYDVLQPAGAQLTALGSQLLTHLYYFATPPIFRRKSGPFDSRRFEEFNAFYLTGFLDLVQCCARGSDGGIRVFYPSTAFIDRRPADMTEYAMSKAAGEVLCGDLQDTLPGVQVLIRRLPRLPTDQTNSVLTLDSADPVGELLAVLRQMHS